MWRFAAANFLFAVAVVTNPAIGNSAGPSSQITMPTFADVLHGALARSLEAKRAALLLDQAKHAEDAVGYGYYPGLGAAASWRQRGPDAMTNSGQTQTYSARLSFDIYDFGRRSAKRELASREAQLRAAALHEINEELTWRVARSYHGMVAAARLLTISTENMRVSQTRFHATRKNYEDGLRSENDVVAAEADFGVTQLNYDKAQTELSLLIRQLEVLMGSPAIASSNLTQVPPAKTAEEWETLMSSWSATPVTAATQKRVIEREAVNAAESSLRAATRPNLSASLNAERADSPATTATNSYTGQLELSWNLTWPGLYRAEREQLLAGRSIIDMEDAIEKRQREETATLAQERFSVAKRLALSADAQQKLRARQHELVRARYNAGKATVLELSAAELEFGNARMELARIKNALAAAVLDLAEAKNIPDPRSLFR